MEAIDILGNQPKLRAAPLEFHDGDVRRIRRFRRDQFAPPVVPFPHQARIALEGFRGGKVFRAKVAPQAIGAPKRRHAAIR